MSGRLACQGSGSPRRQPDGIAGVSTGGLDNFDAVFTPDGLGFRHRQPPLEIQHMDLLMVALAVGFFVLSGWLISALDRL